MKEKYIRKQIIYFPVDLKCLDVIWWSVTELFGNRKVGMTVACVLLESALCNIALNFNMRRCHMLKCLWITTGAAWHRQPGVGLVDAVGVGLGGINRLAAFLRKPSKHRDGNVCEVELSICVLFSCGASKEGMIWEGWASGSRWKWQLAAGFRTN